MATTMNQYEIRFMALYRVYTGTGDDSGDTFIASFMDYIVPIGY